MAEETRALPVPSADCSARQDGWRLGVPAAAFLAHFGAVYGWNGLACSFGWAAIGFGPLGLVPAVVLLLTALAMGIMWWARPAAVQEAPETASGASDPYDPRERQHFMATTTRMLGWLAGAGMLMVALTSLLARTCGPGA